MRARIFVSSVVVFAAVSAGAARADIAPPDACTSPGQPCQTAGPGYDQAGVCVTALCTKYIPAADGGGTTMRYNCNLCQVSDAGVSTGTGGGGEATGGSPGTGGSKVPPNCCGVASGCAVAPGDGAGLTGLGLLAMAATIALSRRRAGSKTHARD
jgi:MYXO-CTERM domain-containing protein